jgi:hypothetical protein
MDPLALIAAAEKAEPSKTPFYFVGGALALWAVVLSALGLTHAEFPGRPSLARGVMALSTVLVIAAMATAVATS